MTINEYQQKTSETAVYPGRGEVGNVSGLAYTALGLAGEAGEICNKVKKILRDSNGVISTEVKQDLKKEMGDVGWYFSEFATMLGYTLEDILQANLEKLADRKARGVLAGSGDNR